MTSWTIRDEAATYPQRRGAGVALEHLDFAVRDMKMQPSLERALIYRGILKAWDNWEGRRR